MEMSKNSEKFVRLILSAIIKGFWKFMKKDLKLKKKLSDIDKSEPKIQIEIKLVNVKNV